MAAAAAVAIANGYLRAGPAAARAHRGARRARRRRGQGVRHRVAPRRLLRLGGRPGQRRPAARRRGLVPGLHPAGPHRGAAPGRARRVDARSPTSGPRPSRWASTPAAGSWSGPSGSSLLGLGLLFESLLVPVLWVMLVLTLFTAVQRFVKVWRQASAPQVQPAGGPVAVAPRGPVDTTHLASPVDGPAAAGGDGRTRADRRPADLEPMDLVTPAYRAASLVAQALPGGVVEAAPAARGGLLAWRPSDRREMVERNLRRVDPGLRGAALRRRVQDVYASYGRYWAESFRLPAIGPARARRRHVVRGLRARRGGAGRGHRSAASCLPHLGGWEWAPSG